MFKKFLTMMMVVSIFTVNAHAVSNQGLKAAFDELNYSLSVEWDQKDKKVYDAEMKKFNAAIKDLQAKGLTNAQLVEFVKSEIKNEKIANEVEAAFNMIQINKMSSSEAASYMAETMKRSYAQGASWNGSAALALVGVGVLLIVVGVALAGSGGGYGGGGYCSDVYVCDTTCYDDWYYGYTCYDDCYWTCY